VKLVNSPILSQAWKPLSVNSKHPKHRDHRSRLQLGQVVAVVVAVAVAVAVVLVVLSDCHLSQVRLIQQHLFVLWHSASSCLVYLQRR